MRLEKPSILGGDRNLEDCLEIFKSKNHPYYELAEYLKAVAKGQECTMVDVIEALKEAVEHFQESAFQHNWKLISFYDDQRMLDSVAIDFIRGGSFE